MYEVWREIACCFVFFFSSRRRHTRSLRDWSSDVCSSDLLATDGSGFDTKTRKPKAIKFRARVRSKFGEFFRGREDDEWTVLLDVAIGTRSSDQPQMVQRHEGRVWASSIVGEQDRAAATERLLAELGKRWSEALP